MQRLIQVLLVLILVLTNAQTALAGDTKEQPFKDVDRYEQEIGFLVNESIIKGYGDSTFKPNNPVKRMQAVQMIINAMGVKTSDAPAVEYTDVKPGDYGYEYIAKATELGFISGKKDGSFDPWANLTRAQMASILVEAFDLQGSTLQQFDDISENYWAYNTINTLAANRITRGYPDQTFRPSHELSRAHFSVFLAKVLDESLIPANRGNEVGNIQNSTNVARENGWIYFADQGILKWKVDEEETYEILPSQDTSAYQVNVVGDWIYYINALNNHAVHAIQINGENGHVVVDGPVTQLTVIDDTLYFIQDHQLYQVDREGNNREQLLQENADRAIVLEDTIYYLNEGRHLKKLQREGNETPITLAKGVQSFDVEEGHVFYIEGKTGEVHQLNDGTSEPMTDMPALTLNVQGDWVYYSSAADFHIYKIHVDGTRQAKVSDYPTPGGLTLLGDRMSTGVLYENNLYSYIFSKLDGTVLYEVGPFELPEQLQQ